MRPSCGGDVPVTRAPPYPSRGGIRVRGPMPVSRRGPGWADSLGRRQGCRSGVGWMAGVVGSSWEEGRCGGSWSEGWT